MNVIQVIDELSDKNISLVRVAQIQSNYNFLQNKRAGQVAPTGLGSKAQSNVDSNRDTKLSAVPFVDFIRVFPCFSESAEAIPFFKHAGSAVSVDDFHRRFVVRVVLGISRLGYQAKMFV